MKTAEFQGLFLCSLPSLSEYLHHTVPRGHGGPPPHSSPGGHLTEQLGQFALHLRRKHFIMELLLHDAQEDCVQGETTHSEQVSVESHEHGGQGPQRVCTCAKSHTRLPQNTTYWTGDVKGGSLWKQGKGPSKWPETMAN